jgi:hypothetical protein
MISALSSPSIELPGLLGGLFGEADDRLADLLASLVAEHDGAEHFLFGKLLGLGFDHHHRVGSAGDDKVEIAVLLAARLGLRIYSPSLKPTRAPPIGPMNGTPEMVSAAEAAIIATMSGSFSPS